MTTAGSIDPPVDTPLQEASSRDLGQRRHALLLRILRVPVKLLWGMLFMQSFLGSILIVGWTNRLARRRALKRWWKKSPVRGSDQCFEHFASRHPDLGLRSGWPNWFLREGSPYHPLVHDRESKERRWGRPKAWLESLKVNFKSGFQTVLNTWVVTAPPCALWVFAWYFGWNNSFHKGYELSGIGPLTGLVGVFLFIAVMFYLPLAQIRQAVTGDWRSFYELRFIRALLRESWIACLFLALFYTQLFFPVIILKTLPGFFSNMNPALLDATPVEVRSILNRYFFWSALVVFPAFVILRLAAARIYSSSLLRAVRRGSIPESSLGSVGRTVLKDLDLLQVEARRPSTLAARLLGGAGKALIRTLVTVLTVVVWFSFFALVFIGQFFAYRGALGWLNQPLVQLPWFHYVPITVRDQWAEVIVSLLLVAALVLLTRTWGSLRRMRASSSTHDSFQP